VDTTGVTRGTEATGRRDAPGSLNVPGAMAWPVGRPFFTTGGLAEPLRLENPDHDRATRPGHPLGLRRVHGIAQMRDTHTGDDCRIPRDDRAGVRPHPMSASAELGEPFMNRMPGWPSVWGCRPSHV
jgi:hypothetical protein